MDPKAIWEQTQINELEGFILLDTLPLAGKVIQPLHQIEPMVAILEEEENKLRKQPIHL